MSKEALIYVVIFLICLLIGGSLLVTSYIKNIQASIATDTLKDDIPEVLPAIPLEPETEVEEQLEESQSSFLETTSTDNRTRTFLNRAEPERENALQQHEQQYLDLVRQLRMLFGEADTEEETEDELEIGLTREEEMEITIASMNAQIDSLMIVIHSFIHENERLKKDLAQRDEEIKNLRQLNENLTLIISNLRQEIYILQNPIIVEEEEPIEEILEIIEPDYRLIARIFNNMDANRVAQILQTLPPETSANILKTMNQRRIAQVMAALPPRVATQYAELLIN